MGLMHKEFEVHGVQFHILESIKTGVGIKIIKILLIYNIKHEEYFRKIKKKDKT